MRSAPRVPRAGARRLGGARVGRMGVAVVVVAAIAVVGAIFVFGGLGRTCACGPSSPIDGIVTEVQATGLTEVQGFTLRIAGGSTVRFVLGPLENATQFPPGHLEAHQASASPVRVYFTTNGSTYTVYRLEDAPVSSSSP